jgi:hypothetical protein
MYAEYDVYSVCQAKQTAAEAAPKETNMAKQTQTTSTRANELTFGIEIETTIPTSQPVNIGAYHRGAANSWLPTGWTVQRDCSIRPAYGYRGIEVVSPILRGADGLKQIEQVMTALNERGCKTNRSCGTHVHIGTSRRGTQRALWAANVINLVGQHETALYAASGTKNRERGQWCRPVTTNRSYSYEAISADLRRAGASEALTRYMRDARMSRYSVLNLNHIHTRSTVEFRCFSGTLSATKAKAWVSMTIAICEKALLAKRAPRFKKPTTSDVTYRGKGAGQKALKRFEYLTGWVLGRKDCKALTVEALGSMESNEALKAYRTELKRLVKKYDAEA